ncbi:MAG: shikimate dehydrogenase [Deferribacteres bacterium]|jgi:shikimate dehydrogenase|nr:aroE [Deferribacteraceae bacterium]MDK2791888.1 shikimate dehydrogenase [Deferribacteres bacterium]
MYSNTGLIGYPLEHSLSPKIHTYLYYKSLINGGYCCFEINRNELEDTINQFKRFKFKGFNVTLPYKIDVIKFLNELSTEAQEIGAVNTVKISNNKLYGYNTDLYGIIKTFELFSVSPQNKKILVLGSGGASRALFYFLKDKRCHVDVVNRTVINTENLLKEMKIEKFNIHDLLFLKKNNYYDIIINTTSVGIQNGEFFDMKNINCGEFAFDFQYSVSSQTPFLSIYNSLVEKRADGIYMLIYQAVKAFSYFHDIEIDVSLDKLAKFIYNKRVGK